MNFSSSIYGIFSTLTPREGSGFSKRLTCYIQHDFNSRSSHGERYHKKPNLRVHHEFQFSLPVWGAVILYGRFYLFHEFQFTFPAWGAIAVFSTLRGVPSISILAPCVGSDLTDPSLIVPNHDFNSRPCVRSDGCYFKKFFFLRIFNSRSLCGERSVLGFLTGLTAIISILAPSAGSD